ncbi:acetyl-CoA acetyltransferase [Mycolicibacterium setense]|uniref:thiolase domain-containing protein n=1 Tax=Mycolicibacterium setense TaxID=431269 RepID=UPI0007EAEE2D|nr:thiolase domain-containing protein [Mycolicibacterium setense]OBB17646.1 acetyl-CoA acetyltransferase [Mycolicibacterium setense]
MNARACIAGAFEHPGRHLPERSLAQLHADVALGALADAGLTLSDVDGYLSTPDVPGLGLISMADYLGLANLNYTDTTDTGGSAYIAHVGHAAMAIDAGLCSVVLVTMIGKSRTSGGPAMPSGYMLAPEINFEWPFGSTIVAEYALATRRHMHEFGTTSEQLAEVKVAASKHAAHNPNAFLRDEVSAETVMASPIIADPLHRLDCCINTDGGGALVIVAPEIARELNSERCVPILGHASAIKASYGGHIDLTSTAAIQSGPRAYEMAGVAPGDIDYVGLYDSFTITVLMQLEDLGFCKKGDGGPFVASGALRAGTGELPTNTDGGGLCNSHPGARGGMPKLIEAVRQLRGEAIPEVQVRGCDLALVNGTGGSIGTRMGSATAILGRR